MTRCPSDATKPHPKEIAARLVDEWLEPVPHADKPDPVLLLNLVERIGSALESARASGVEEAALLLEDGARVSELHARVTACSQTHDRFLHLAKFERLHAEDIRALTKKENE